MTELMSKRCQGINANNTTDDIQVMQWIVTLSPVLRMVYLACYSQFCSMFFFFLPKAKKFLEKVCDHQGLRHKDK